MAKLKEMLDIAGSMKKAEQMAKDYVQKDNAYLLDLVLLLATQGKTEEAWETIKKAQKIYPEDDVRLRYNMGWYVMMQGDMLKGFELMNVGRSDELWGNAHIGSSMPIWNGEPLEGKHVLFYSEAGLGDEIVFVRFAREMAKLGAKITLVCNPGLASIFSQLPEISSIVEPRAMLGVYHDYWIPSMLSPVPLKKQFKDISGEAFLKPKEFYVNKFKSIMKTDKFKVGIRWLGQKGDDYINRVFDERMLFNAVDQEGVKVYSLQKDVENKSNYPEWLIDMDDHLDTWEDTMGVIENLDLVITSCTSIAHIAGAMGKPTWVIVPSMMYFIWSYPITSARYDRSLWYDSVRLYRQKRWNKWEVPISGIKKDLQTIKSMVLD